MTVCLIDKRRRGQQIPSVEMPNHTWFCVLDIDGMDTLVDTRHYCDTATATPAKAKKMAALIENWTPPDGWCNGNDRDWHENFDVTRMILSAKEELANEAHPIDGLSGEYAEKSLEEWAEQIRKGSSQ